MRLTMSLALWLVSLSALVVGVHGWSHLTETEEDLYAAASEELTLATTAVRVSVENALRDDQQADIGSLLEQLELMDPSFDVFVFRGVTDVLSRSWSSDANLERALAIARRPLDLGVQRLPEGYLAAATPLRAGGSVVGHVVVLRHPTALQAHLRRERNAVLVSIGVLVVLLSVVIWAVVKLRLQRPITQMIETVRRVAAGDLSARIRWQSPDELSELSREFDAMVDALESARSQLSQEAETRERLEAEMVRTNRLAIAGGLAATLAHEVGSPLQVLGGRARDIVRRQDLPDEVVRGAGIIADQVDRLHEIVERFLDVARRKAPVVEDVNLRGAVEEVTELLASQARRAGVRLREDVPEGLFVRADPAQLQQVLLNLLQNALRASPGGGTVRVHAKASSFRRVANGLKQPAVALSVEDEGPGIPAADRDLVFEPFFTGWNAGSKPEAGTGLGLSVVKTIVMDHGGVVDVRTGSTGHGARFVTKFPTASEFTAVSSEALA